MNEKEKENILEHTFWIDGAGIYLSGIFYILGYLILSYLDWKFDIYSGIVLLILSFAISILTYKFIIKKIVK
ncbi:hypothetical protein KKF81_00985 [Candidatus Micrarchaeota archaeon]|nr:hypothetical protein [Candidatus Micrarchaeota archaeon]MBU1165494.1 hypothetical protein [Candidatus Micrarchaeota archaeon]MBU1886332.1 hypothetical protein [Candidatus Micrarchaeota archaeon]